MLQKEVERIATRFPARAKASKSVSISISFFSYFSMPWTHGAAPVKFIILTNGNNTYIYKRGDLGFKPLDHLPSYEEMT